MLADVDITKLMPLACFIDTQINRVSLHTTMPHWESVSSAPVCVGIAVLDQTLL